MATFDLHANYTQQMVESADMLIGYDTYPHTDGYERGVEAVNLTKKMLEGKLKPTLGIHPATHVTRTTGPVHRQTPHEETDR